MVHARTCKVSRKYSDAFSRYSAKTKRDGQIDRQMGAFQHLPPRAFGTVGDNNTYIDRLQNNTHTLIKFIINIYLINNSYVFMLSKHIIYVYFY